MKIEITDKITITTEYLPSLIMVLQKIPAGRRYDKATHSWIIDLNQQNLSYLVKAGVGVEVFTPLLQEIEKPLGKPDIENFQKYKDIQIWKNTIPYNHQVEGLYILDNNQYAALFWEQGCGKTLPVIKALECIGIPALIVCPRNVMQTWAEQFEMFSNIKPVIIKGTAKKRSEILQRCVKNLIIKEVVIINYDILTAMQKELTALHFPILVFDESHYIKNGQAARSKAAHAISKNAGRRYLLSGTPIGNGSIDLFHQFLCLDPAIFGTSFFAFRARYFRDKGFDFINKNGKPCRAPDWRIRPDMIDELKTKIISRSQRALKSECTDLPEKIYQRVYLELDAQQIKLYRQIESEIKVMVQNKEITVKEIITKMGKLNQICNGFLYADDDEIMINDDKVNELIEIWETAGRPKMVVWTVYQVDVLKISAAFNKISVPNVQITGRNSQDDNDSARRNFQETETTRVIICNQKAGGVGITLTASNFVVNYSHNFSYIDRVQAEDRTHRIGQKNKVTYIDMICQNTIEQTIIDALEAKKAEAAEVLGDREKGFQQSIINKFKEKEL